MSKINCNLIVAGPATGKTYLALNDKRFVDLDGERAAYKYGFSSISELEVERSKGERGEVVNRDSLQYITRMIDEVVRDKRIGLLSYHEDILDYVWKKFYEKDVLDTKATYKIELEKNKYLFDIRDCFLEE